MNTNELMMNLSGFEYLSKIFSMVLDSPIAQLYFLKSIGYKYLYEGYVKLSSISQSINISHELLRDTSSVDEYISKHFKILKAILPTESELADKIQYLELISCVIPKKQKYSDIVESIWGYQNKSFFQYPDSPYFETILEEMVCICSCGQPLNDLHKNKLIEKFLFDYLSELVNIEKQVSIPIYCNSANLRDYVYDPKRVELFEVESTSQYIKKITDIVKPITSDKEIFFRGHKSTSYSLCPSIFRDEKWRWQEKTMYDELERLCPNSFVGMNKLLDILVEMQHYELPTRLLDISNNSLVALLFACEKEKNDDGEILIFSCFNQEVLFGHSDKVSLLTALSQMNHVEKGLLYHVALLFADINRRTNRLTMKEFDEFLCKINGDDQNTFIQSNELNEANLKNQISDFPFLKSDLPIITRTIKELFTIKNMIVQEGEERQKFELDEKEMLFYSFNKMEIVNRLVRQVQREKPYFENRIIPSDLLRVLFVKSAMLNQRIIKQSGAFLVCGLMPEDNGEIVKLLNKYRYSGNKKPVIIVPAKNKSELLKELRIFDLHTASIYPEIDKVAGYIKEQSKGRPVHCDIF